MPSAYQVHPEFGYLCPSPRLRRKAKLVLGFLVLGSIAAASQMVLPGTDREPGVNNGPVAAGRSSDPAPVSSGVVAAPAIAAQRAQSQPTAPEPAAVRTEPPSVSPQRAPMEASASATIKPPSQQLIAMPKKPRKPARRQERRRDRDEHDAYAWRRERAEHWGRPIYRSHFWPPGW
jgi:hypothetical protein